MAAAIAATLTAGIPASASTPDSYVPSPEIVTAQQEFADNGFGIFSTGASTACSDKANGISTTALRPKNMPNRPKPSILPTSTPPNGSRHSRTQEQNTSRSPHAIHDGFSMFATRQSDYNIVDATPFKRDILKELADECEKQGLKTPPLLLPHRLDTTRLSVGTHRP